MTRHPLTCIVPTDLLLRLAADPEVPDDPTAALLRTVELDTGLRVRRAELVARFPSQRPSVAANAGGTPNRQIYDQHHESSTTPGTLVRGEGDDAVADVSVNQAYDAFGHTYDFYWQLFERNSIDDAGLPIQGLVHYGTDYDNAFWDGEGHMFFGDGDGQTLTDTTAGVDVVGHELTHGVTQYTANLTYSGQSGALNESVSDVFGIMIKQRALGVDSTQSDWLIGAEIVGPALAPALRSMKAPGTANKYDNQPATMDHYLRTTSDNGGVHTNSGIPNHAFYVVATTLGGNAWEAPGRIWYTTLTGGTLPATATFADFAAHTLTAAGTLFGATSAEADAVKAGWDAVKVKPTAAH
jgi:Zn-dependent metalloprotease